jgi:hypothetical protein
MEQSMERWGYRRFGERRGITLSGAKVFVSFAFILFCNNKDLSMFKRKECAGGKEAKLEAESWFSQ